MIITGCFSTDIKEKVEEQLDKKYRPNSSRIMYVHLTPVKHSIVAEVTLTDGSTEKHRFRKHEGNCEHYDSPLNDR